MKHIILLCLFVSCTHAPRFDRPDWVSGIRDGSEKSKVSHGSKIYYRRIAGGAHIPKQTSCDLVVMKASEDIQREFPHLQSVPYTVEVLFYDKEFLDCAVTLSVDKRLSSKEEDLKAIQQDADSRKAQLLAKENPTPEEVADILLLRSEIAANFALTGLTVADFEKFSKEKVTLIQGQTDCATSFKTNIFSVHGLTHVCWSGEHVQGYCTTKSKQCWKRSP